MEFREATINDLEGIAPLLAKFRVTLKSFKGIEASEDLVSAREEYKEYLQAKYSFWGCFDGGKFAGYLVCRIDEPTVWVESIFVAKEYRRKGIGKALFKKAEEIAQSYGEESLFIYVHPNNDGMIRFLDKLGYNVLNLIEIRKQYTGEQTTTQLLVGNHQFNY